jgi:hypothetical protein
MGIMSVVSDVSTEIDDEREPTWDEAMAALDAAAPVEVVRSARSVTVIYRYADGMFTATSPDVRGFRVSGPSLHETQRAARDDLADFLDPAVGVVERFPAPEPEIMTAACGRSSFQPGSLSGIFVLSSSGTARTYVSSARATLPRVRASQ